MPYSHEHFEQFIGGFIQAMLFCTPDERPFDEREGEFLDSSYNYNNIDFQCINKLKSECIDFLDRAMPNLHHLPFDVAGMNFFYARNGHGAGFFDYEIPKEDIKALMDISKCFKEVHPYAENGTIYIY